MEDIQRLLGSLEEFKNHTKDSLEKLTHDVEDILMQTTKTNGRVTQLEKENNKGKDWRDKVILILISALVGMLFNHFLGSVPIKVK